jgi:hypothetical protein
MLLNWEPSSIVVTIDCNFNVANRTIKELVVVRDTARVVVL